jgi:AcrR family transcriptional regulator
MHVKSRKAEQSEATRAALMEVARGLFSDPGYAEVSTEEIVTRAGVTRGALYHHFKGKKDLFRAVFERLEQELAEQIAAVALSETDPWRRQLLAVQAFLDGCLDPAVQRIALVDAPSVLGLEAWREIEETYGLALVRAGLESVIEAGLIERQPIEPLAHLILGALIEAGLMIARADDVGAVRGEVGASVERLLDGLRVARTS